MIDGVQVPFSAEEETARDAEEAAWAAGANDRAFAALREERNRKLAETDWVVTMHKELGTTIPSAWKTYRQELRDLPADTSDPTDVTWPTKPS
jgi:hypothetical protein